MEAQTINADAVWHEQSAIWEVIAGELVVQAMSSSDLGQRALESRARDRAVEARDLLRKDELDGAGHALIGCTLALALAAREETPSAESLEHYASDLAGTIAWVSAIPTAEDLDELVAELRGRALRGGGRPTLWELANLCGAYAAGLSPFITRRRERRDVLAATRD
jgi:hypothetical protein